MSSLSLCLPLLLLAIFIGSTWSAAVQSRPANEWSDAFGLQLSQVVTREEDQGNALLSPLALTSALLFLLKGSSGQTRDDLKHVLDIQDTDDVTQLGSAHEQMVARALRHLTRDGDEELVVLTRLLVQRKGLKGLRETFKRALREELKEARVEHVDFESSADEVRQRVNTWIGNATDGRLGQFLRDVPAPNASMVLLSALDFRGGVRSNFSQSGERKVFQNFVSDHMPYVRRHVPYLESRDAFRQVKSNELKSSMVEVPLNNDVSLIIVEPEDVEVLQFLSENMTSGELREAIEGLMEVKPRPLKLLLPKFKVETDLDLKEVFEDVFETKSLFTSAEFVDKDFRSDDTSGQRLTSFVHKTQFELKSNSMAEKTTDSSAEEVEEYRVKRPFFFFLRLNSEKVFLLIGKIVHLLDEEALGLGFI